MQTVKFGKTGLDITTVGFGSWAIGGSGWRAAWGGATVFGDVIDKRRVETPWDSPIELFEWRVGEAARYVPRFNSLLVMWLDEGHAHGVEEVTSDEPRLSLIGIYARAESAGDNGRSPG